MDTTLPISPDSAEGSSVRCLHWAHGTAELQALGGMLAPVVFRAAGAPDFQPLQVAPCTRVMMTPAMRPSVGAPSSVLLRLRST